MPTGEGSVAKASIANDLIYQDLTAWAREVVGNSNIQARKPAMHEFIDFCQKHRDEDIV
jgi:hypothetical protein